MNFIVNDIPYRSVTGFVNIKNRYGRDGVLTKLAPYDAHSQKSDTASGAVQSGTSSGTGSGTNNVKERRELTPSSQPQTVSPPGASTQDTPPPLPVIVVCAVDAHGFFRVENGQSYRVCALHAGNQLSTTLYDPVATHLDVQAVLSSSAEDVKKEWLQRRRQRERWRARREQLRQLRGEFGPRAPVRRRAENKYSRFTGKFMATFENTSFADAAREWHSFSPAEREAQTPDELVHTLMKERDYLFARY